MYIVRIRHNGNTSISRANNLEGALALLPYYLGYDPIVRVTSYVPDNIHIIAASRKGSSFVKIHVDRG